MSAWVVPYHQGHMLYLNGRESEIAAWDALGGQERADTLCDAGDYAYSVICETGPVACIGVTKYWTGVGAAWAFLSPQALRYMKTIHDGVSTFLRGALVEEFHRIETSVRIDHAQGHRWVLRLGFIPEGIRRQYGHDRKDYVLYARCAA